MSSSYTFDLIFFIFVVITTVKKHNKCSNKSNDICRLSVGVLFLAMAYVCLHLIKKNMPYRVASKHFNEILLI